MGNGECGMVKVTVTPAKPAGMMKRDWNKVLKGALGRMGTGWHSLYMPRKFEPSAVCRYGYRPRSIGYNKRKLRIKGHKNPLVWSGRSKRLTSIRKVRATSKGSRVIMNAPQLNRRKLRLELIKVIVREVVVLSRRAGKYVNRKLKPV